MAPRRYREVRYQQFLAMQNKSYATMVGNGNKGEDSLPEERRVEQMIELPEVVRKGVGYAGAERISARGLESSSD